ncbi:1-acyl-sn-glycerol-3-phosphate acyltransferase alpha-like [Bradysia coprophila]|uniref:1-acyl-sn-glycerol-3-phosphate acyltransferase alpha-like n=1 Tax=Bradysia coprophila TaxID=38358 RepID=UPI00187D9246|nr:1-acyl-sn-glycerol-3-phosphate acyltransferase alpha-like [Bradysia coprophila]
MFFYELFGFSFILFVTFKYRHPVQYYAKFTFYILTASAASAILPYVGLFRYPIRDYRNGMLPAWSFRMIVQLLGLEYEVRGLENVDKNEGGVVVVAPHQSILDLSVDAYLWPLIGRPIGVTKNIVLYVFPFGIGMWICGSLFIDRKNRQNAVKQLHAQTEAIQSRRNKIVIFPEGTRAQQNKIMPFKKGAFHLAIDSQSMIQPVVVSNYHFLSSAEKRFQKGKIIISILPAMSCKGMTKDDVNIVLERTKRLMDIDFEKISNETKPQFHS